MASVTNLVGLHRKAVGEGSEKLLETGYSNGSKHREVQESSMGFRQQLLAVVVCAAWMGVSNLLIVLNKYLLTTDEFHFPMALAGMGMTFSGLASFLACRVFRVVEAKKQITLGFFFKNILPVGLFMAGSLHLGNYAYLHLTVSFIQMLKAFTPIVTMVALFVARIESPTRSLVLAVVVIALGTAVASYGEMNLSVLGVSCMLLSETFEAVRLVMTQYLLVGLRFHPIEGLMYLASACAFWLGVGMFCFEYNTMVAEHAFQKILDKPGYYLLAACMGFCINSLAFFVIQLTSSLTLKVLGTVKNAALVLFCTLFLNETVTLLQTGGYTVSLGAFLMYTKLKYEISVQGNNEGQAPANGSKSRLPPLNGAKPNKRGSFGKPIQDMPKHGHT